MPNITRTLTTLATVAAIAAASGCGDDDESAPPAPTSEASGATGAAGPSGEDVPGAPDAGEPLYTALGSYWTELPSGERIASAAEFIADNEDACGGIAPEDLARQAGVAYGVDYPLNVHVDDVMLETCALLRNGA
jgi:hypothetical protein